MGRRAVRAWPSSEKVPDTKENIKSARYVSEDAQGRHALAVPRTPHGLPVPWVRGAGILVVFCLLFRHGFPIAVESVPLIQLLELLLALAFAADLALAARDPAQRQRASELRRFEFLALALVAGLVAGSFFAPAEGLRLVVRFFNLESAGAFRLNLVELFLLLSLTIQMLRGTERLVGRGVRPEVILAGSFATLILIGTLLLLLPNSSAKPEDSLDFLDALFMATSAATVTGLAVRDVGTDLSGFGQMALLAIVQVGGLGIITFVAFMSVFSARTLPVSQMIAFRQIIAAPSLSNLKRQLVGIVVITLFIEFIGAALIFSFLPVTGDAFERIRWSVFHSVGAFCNAGFSFHADSLERYRADAALMVTFMCLMALGALGFIVMSELISFRFTQGTFFRRLSFFRRRHAGKTLPRLSVQTRLALTTTAALLVGVFVMFWLLEVNYTLQGRSLKECFFISAFHSVTPRSAGFNTVPIHQLRDATLVFLMIVMVIGANPISTGGGIKTVNLAILLLGLRAMVLRRDKIEAFGRTIPQRTMLAALSVFLIYMIMTAAGIFLLAVFDPQMRLQDQAFEVISALSTVGLSTGVTADLSPASQLVLCVLMFIGRIGPISLVLSVFQSKVRTPYAYPEEEVIVG